MFNGTQYLSADIRNNGNVYTFLLPHAIQLTTKAVCVRACARARARACVYGVHVGVYAHVLVRICVCVRV